MKRKIFRSMAALLLALCVLVNGLVLFVYATDYLHLGQALRLALLVKARALQPVSIGKILDSMTKGVVKSLNDPYSSYLSEEDFSRLQDEIDGIFGGLGLILDTSNEDRLVVQGVLGGSPAEKAGLQRGDLITAVNGTPVVQIKSMPAADLLKGPVGTEVVLSLLKAKGGKQEVKVARALISIKSVQGKMLKIPQPVGYIKINSFNEQTADELAEVIKALPGVKGLLLDLRDNPGGSLEAAVNTAQYFVPKGPVVHLIYRSGKRETYETGEQLLNLPLVVLVNNGTASSAEILTAAIKDTASGLVVGTKTYGKGVVQTIFELGDSAGLKLTTAKYLSPLGKDIDHIGIQPDVAVEQPEDPDKMLAKALKLLAERI